jgi:DNA polymerase epsilon subunit 2
MHKFIGKETPAKRAVPPSSALPSSSPAFATPAHALKPYDPTPAVSTSTRHAILRIDLPPATLRPLAFRTFTKKHSLTLTSSSLEELAGFIGRHCGSGWREEGLAEKVLEEVAKGWKSRDGGVIVDGASPELKEILTTLEANMSGGRIIPGGKGLSRQNSSFLLDASQDADVLNVRQGLPPTRTLTREDSQKSFGMSNLVVEDEIDDEALKDVRKWLRVVDAYDQPRLMYNVDQKHFEKCAT